MNRKLIGKIKGCFRGSWSEKPQNQSKIQIIHHEGTWESKKVPEGVSSLVTMPLSESDFMSALKKRTLEIADQIPKVEKHSFHNLMQKKLRDIAIEFGAVGETEYPVQDGRIDVVWYDKEGSPLLALELDSSPRRKSILKLIQAKNTHGFPYAVWICYTKYREKLSRIVDQHDPEKLVHIIHLPGLWHIANDEEEVPKTSEEVERLLNIARELEQMSLKIYQEIEQLKRNLTSQQAMPKQGYKNDLFPKLTRDQRNKVKSSITSFITTCSLKGEPLESMDPKEKARQWMKGNGAKYISWGIAEEEAIECFAQFIQRRIKKKNNGT